MMEKLISNTEFGFYVRSLEVNDHKKLELRENYDAFLKQNLSLGMFVPCKLKDGVWVVLEEPEQYKNVNEFNDFIKQEKEAKDGVLFEGFHIIGIDKQANEYQLEMIDKDFWLDFINGECTFEDEFIVDDIEELLNVSRCVEINLTQTAQKKIL